MRILFIGYKDSGNYGLPNIVKALEKRGHFVDVYCVFLEYHNVKMFSETEINFKPAELLTVEIMESYDFIYIAECIRASDDIGQKLMSCKNYIFSSCNLFHNIFISTVSDFVFTVGENSAKYLDQLGYIQPKMIVGNPQYDSIINHNEKSGKKILFVDRGYYPFDSIGKRELAKMLLRICENFPDFEVCIKPRFLMNENKNITHYNKEHLYSVIYEISNNQIPINMNLLQEHVNLEELINESCCVITPFSSCYVEAGLANKGIILLDGLPSNDTIEFRLEHVNEIKERMSGSKCIVHYKNIMNFLPYGIKCDTEYLKQEVYCNDGVGEKIADNLEELYKNYISQGLVPNKGTYKYNQFEGTATPYNSTDLDWSAVISRRIINQLQLIKHQERLKVSGIDWSYVEKIISSVSREEIVKIEYYNEFIRFIKNIMTTYIISQKDQLFGDKISESILLNLLFQQKKNAEIKKIDIDSLKCKEGYFFFKGKINIEEKRYDEAINCFENFIHIQEGKKYIETLLDYEAYILSAYFSLGVAYLNFGDHHSALKNFLVCDERTEGKHAAAKEYIHKIMTGDKNERY
jgi:tetratricopeptide (TPR) repeat protein